MGTDYTSCEGKDCPIKDKCYRFYGPKEPMYQSWFSEIPGKWTFHRETFDNGEIFDHREFHCDMFWVETPISMFNALKEIMK